MKERVPRFNVYAFYLHEAVRKIINYCNCKKLILTVSLLKHEKQAAKNALILSLHITDRRYKYEYKPPHFESVTENRRTNAKSSVKLGVLLSVFRKIA